MHGVPLIGGGLPFGVSIRQLTAVSAASLLLLSGCTRGDGRTAPAEPLQTGERAASAAPSKPSRPARTTRPATRERAGLVDRYGDFPAFAATARAARVAVRRTPDGAVSHTLRNPQPSGAPLTFLVKQVRGEWLQVHLPVRPNGSTGWVRERDVAITGVTYRVDVHLGAHRLEVFKRGKRVGRYPIGVGTQNTPTPGGTFYLKELLKPTNEGGIYGPYAYGLSGFSNVLTKFAGGEGVIGIHGTNDESTIGKDVSKGCIRLRNADITRLVALLPLGTPVRILP